jgi:hypothetical protein
MTMVGDRQRRDRLTGPVHGSPTDGADGADGMSSARILIPPWVDKFGAKARLATRA